MIAPCDPYLEAFAKAGSDIITVHVEAGPHMHRSLQAIRALGKKAGVTLNPGTPVETIEQVIDLVDLVLVMSVNPGFGGQTFIPSAAEKIAPAARRSPAAGRSTSRSTAASRRRPRRAVARAGANVLVAGSAVFKGGKPDDYRANIAAIRNAAALGAWRGGLMGVLIDGKWTRRRAAAGNRHDRRVQARRQPLPRPHHRRRLVRLQGRARPLSSLRRARLPVGAPHADLPRAEEARGRDHGRLFDPGPARSRAGRSRTIPRYPGLHARHRQRLPLHARGLHRDRAATTPARSRCRPCGTRRPSGSSTTSRPRSSGCSTASSTPSPATAPTTIRRRCAPRSTPSTSAIYHNVNNGVYRCGFAKSQAAYEAAYDGLFATLDELEERLSRAALSGRQPDHRGRLAAVSRRCVRFDVAYFSLFKCNKKRIADYPEPVELHARALPGARRRRDRDAALLRHQLLVDRAAQSDRHHPEGNAGRPHAAARPRAAGDYAPVAWVVRPAFDVGS